jgi:LmbE family N-acetylglucosaminyl deacetylase
MKKYLIVVAHPDDEIIGIGGLIKTLSAKGCTFDLCVMSGNVNARKHRPDLKELKENLENAARRIGIRNIEIGNFENIKLNIVPHLDLVQFIEKSILKYLPDSIITHHPNDLNNDHLHTSIACQAAFKLHQRNPKIKPVNEMFFMEVLSSTDWSVNDTYGVFKPNYFIEIGDYGLAEKIETLKLYKNVMRDFPHPRSVEVITGLAAYRGGQSGLKYAEALQMAFFRVEK